MQARTLALARYARTHAHTRTHTHAHAHARTRAHTHTHTTASARAFVWFGFAFRLSGALPATMRRFQRGNGCCAHARTPACGGHRHAARPVGSQHCLLHPRATCCNAAEPLEWARPDERNWLHRSATCNNAPPAASLCRQLHAAASVAARRNLLQRGTTRCIPLQPRLAAATQPTHSAAAAAIGATDGCDRPQSALESFRALRRRTECLVCRVLTPAAL